MSNDGSNGPNPPPSRPHLHRRDVLRAGALATTGLGIPTLLAACSQEDQAQTLGADGELPYELARPDSPVRQPLSDTNPAIADGLEPETGGVFKILNFSDYMAPGVMRDFGEKHDVTVEVTPYTNYDGMLQKLMEGGASYDLIVPGPTVLSRLVYSELLQPFNKSYLSNLANVWPEFQDPWYDLGSQYTVPYTTYTTGVGYRTDRVTDPAEGWDMLWNPDYAGKIGILDSYQESLAMSLLRNDITEDINTTEQPEVADAADRLIELTDLVNLKIGNTAYRSIPEGEFTVDQCWSGDMITGRWYLPEKFRPMSSGTGFPRQCKTGSSGTTAWRSHDLRPARPRPPVHRQPA